MTTERTELQHTLQPDQFRTRDIADWAHFPYLHLLLGFGPGVMETLGEKICGLRNVFVHVVPNAMPSKLVIEYVENCWEQWPVPGFTPSLMIEYASPKNFARFTENGDEASAFYARNCGPHDLCVDGWRVAHQGFGVDCVFMLQQQKKNLRPELIEEMKNRGLDYARGTGKRADRPDRQRTPDEQEFAKFVSVWKQEYIIRRLDILLRLPSSRPPDWGELVRRHAREDFGKTTQSEVRAARTKHDGRVRKKRTRDQLIESACRAVAHREASAAVFDSTWETVFAFSHEHGLVQAAQKNA